MTTNDVTPIAHHECWLTALGDEHQMAVGRSVMGLLLAGIFAAAAVLSAAPSNADPWNPACTITPEQSCNHNGTPPGQLKFCPETGGWISEFSGSCPSLWNGPYSPGGLQPNGGTDDR
jgi:hypothetical protein